MHCARRTALICLHRDNMPRKAGTQNYSELDCEWLLRLALRTVPASADEWDTVASEYNTKYAGPAHRQLRDGVALSRKHRHLVTSGAGGRNSKARPELLALSVQLRDAIDSKKQLAARRSNARVLALATQLRDAIATKMRTRTASVLNVGAAPHATLSAVIPAAAEPVAAPTAVTGVALVLSSPAPTAPTNTGINAQRTPAVANATMPGASSAAALADDAATPPPPTAQAAAAGDTPKGSLKRRAAASVGGVYGDDARRLRNNARRRRARHASAAREAASAASFASATPPPTCVAACDGRDGLLWRWGQATCTANAD